jgi:hypothetical protein
MKIFTIILLIIFFISPVFAYDYEDENIKLTILDNGNFELTIGDILYNLDWIDGRLRTAGIDGTCYWYDGESITDCSVEEIEDYLINKNL